MSHPCQCTPPAPTADNPNCVFFCPLHKMDKHPIWQSWCDPNSEAYRPAHRDAWDNGVGVGQQGATLRGCQHQDDRSVCKFCASADRRFEPDDSVYQHWPAGRLLSKHLAAQQLTGTAIDLGCGSGIAGVGALQAGLHVTFQDRDGIPLHLARSRAQASGLPDDQYAFVNCDWSTVSGRYDVIISSETLWDQTDHQVFISALERIWTGRGPIFLAGSTRLDLRAFLQALAARVRNPSDFAVQATVLQDEQYATDLFRITCKALPPAFAPYVPPEVPEEPISMATAPESGPGTELKALLTSLGISGDEGCGCDKFAAQMNAWGPDGCRDRLGTIRDWLTANMKKYSWSARITAAAKAFATGLAFQINWLDPFPDLIREAIRRAEETNPNVSPTERTVDMADEKKCSHQELESSQQVTRQAHWDLDVKYSVDLRFRCKECGELFKFTRNGSTEMQLDLVPSGNKK